MYRWGNDQEPTCVRDVSWHPSAPVFAATSFQGDGIGKGTVSVHSWRGADVEKQEKGPGVIYTPPVYDTEMGLVQEA